MTDLETLRQRIADVHGALADAGNIVVDYDRLGDGVRQLIAERDAAQEHEDEAWLKVNELRAEVERLNDKLDIIRFDAAMKGKPASFEMGME